jgi:hypothetical protein
MMVRGVNLATAQQVLGIIAWGETFPSIIPSRTLQNRVYDDRCQNTPNPGSV